MKTGDMMMMINAKEGGGCVMVNRSVNKDSCTVTTFCRSSMHHSLCTWKCIPKWGEGKVIIKKALYSYRRSEEIPFSLKKKKT